jgi:hypothetical protein
MSVATKTMYRILLCIFCPHYYYIFTFTFKFDERSAQTLTSKVKCRHQLDATDCLQTFTSGCIINPSTFYLSLNHSLLHILHLIPLPLAEPKTSPMHQFYRHLPQSVMLPPSVYFLKLHFL